MWQTFVQYFASFIEFLYEITVSAGVPNYGLAIIMMTIIIKVALFPLTQKQMKSMKGLQIIQPRIKLLQERYKDDPQTLQAKMGELYKEHNVNPLGGCLPLLVQMPIFIAFYQSLFNFPFSVVEHAKFLWIPNIGNPDPYYIIAILVAGTTYLQQRIAMVNPNDPTQKMLLYMMPFLMAWITMRLPAGLPLYWTMFNILGILQQLYVNITDKKAEEQEKKEKKPMDDVGAQPEANEEKLSQKEDEEGKEEGEEEGGKEENAGPKHTKRRKKRKKH